MIIKQLEEFDIEVLNKFKSKEDEIIITDSITISVNGKEVFINFDINCKASYAARIILILKEIKDIEIFVGDDYTFDEEGKFIDGEEAENFYQEHMKQDSIKDFMKQQSELFYLANMKTYNC